MRACLFIRITQCGESHPFVSKGITVPQKQGKHCQGRGTNSMAVLGLVGRPGYHTRKLQAETEQYLQAMDP